MKKPNKSQIEEMQRILVPGFVVYDEKGQWGFGHIKVIVVSEQEWKQNSKEKFGGGMSAHVKTITTTFACELNYHMGLITKEQWESNQPIVEVEYRKWDLPHTDEDLYKHLIAVSEKNTIFVPSN